MLVVNNVKAHYLLVYHFSSFKFVKFLLTISYHSQRLDLFIVIMYIFRFIFFNIKKLNSICKCSTMLGTSKLMNLNL